MFFAPGVDGGESASSPKRRPLSPTSLPDSQSPSNMSKDYVHEGDLTPSFLYSRTSDEENTNPPLLKSFTDDPLTVNDDVEPAVLSALSQYIDTLRSSSGDASAPDDNRVHPSSSNPQSVGSVSMDQADISPEMLSLVEQYIDHLPEGEYVQNASVNDKDKEDLLPEETPEREGQEISRQVKAKVAPSSNKDHPKDLTNQKKSLDDQAKIVDTDADKKTANKNSAEEVTTNVNEIVNTSLRRILESQQNVAETTTIDSTLAIKPNHKSRIKEDTGELDSAAEAETKQDISADEHTLNSDETQKMGGGSRVLSESDSVLSDSKMQRLIDAVEGWAGEGSFLDHPLLRDVSLDSEALEVLETLVADAGSCSVEEQSVLDESTVPESLGHDLKNFLDSMQQQKRGEAANIPSTLIRLKKDPPTVDEFHDNSRVAGSKNDDQEEAPPLVQKSILESNRKDESAVSDTLPHGNTGNPRAEEEEEKTTENEDTTDEEEKKEDEQEEKEKKDTPWWESMEEAPWFRATAMLGVHAAIEALSGEEDSGSESDSNFEEETIDATTLENPDDKPSNEVNDDIDQFWKSQNALRQRRQQNRWRQNKKKNVELPTLNVASYSYNSQNSKRSEKSEQSTTTVESFARSKMSAESYDSIDERWLLKRSMAGYSFWGKPQFLTSKKTTVLEVDDPEPINGVESTKLLFDLSCRWRERRDSIFSSIWMLSYEDRCSLHRGYQGVNFYSLSESSDVCDNRHHRLDNQPWEKRDVKQFFLHEQSATRRNWFGRLKRYSSVEVDLPVCRPRSMEMPVRAPEWTEDWYRTPHLRSLGTNLSESAEGEATEYYRKYVLSEDEFEEEDEWEDTPECGTIKNVYLKPGERISRVTPDLTSSLRRSRWRKKFFPKGTFPY